MGWSGVGLFLVLSGFSIHFRWASSDVPHHEFAPGKFARRRFFRLYPTYIAAVVASILVALALGNSLDFGAPLAFADGDDPILIGILTQVALVGANVVSVPYVTVTWSLGLEAQLYLMYGVLVGRLRSIGVVRVVVWALVITVVFRVGSQFVTTSMPVGQSFPDGHVTGLSRLLYAQLPARCFEWLLGVLAAEMYFGRVKLPGWARSPWVAVALIALAALIFRRPVGAESINGHPFMLSDVFLDQLLGVAYFAVLLAAIYREDRSATNRAERLIIKPLAAVGIFSYSLYLLHIPTLELSDRVLSDSGIGAVFQTLGQWAFTILVAWLFYLVIERHFTDGRVDRWAAAKWASRGSRLAPDAT